MVEILIGQRSIGRQRRYCEAWPPSRGWSKSTRPNSGVHVVKAVDVTIAGLSQGRER
jgi:hypothetical protein